MPFISRRALMSRGMTVAAIGALCRSSSWARVIGEDTSPVHLSVSVDWENVISSVSPEMLGLSYESSQLSAPDFFSAANTELIALFKKLSPQGVLRLGGNLSEYTVWVSSRTEEKPRIPFRAVGADSGAKKAAMPSPVSVQAIRNLRDFLESTGWRAVYGLNLAQADHARVIDEAVFVADTLRARLIAFQIGNEPDHYVMNGLRAPGYGFQDYFAEWSRIYDAVRKAVPSAQFAGPDIAEDVAWVDAFAKAAPSSVAFLSGHHYAEGPPTDPTMTLERLLSPDPSFNHRLAVTEKIAQEARIPYIMAETNSCYNAGKAGVSDVFGSALWAMDYLLQLAQAGTRGVYFHGGANSWYTPIAGGSGQPFYARPVYYGLLMCRDLLGSELVSVKVKADAANVSIYAVQRPKRLVVINKGPGNFTIELNRGECSEQVLRLLAPSPEAKTGIKVDLQSFYATEKRLFVPKYSATIFDIQSS